jgi:hypothetical protein
MPQLGFRSSWVRCLPEAPAQARASITLPRALLFCNWSRRFLEAVNELNGLARTPKDIVAMSNTDIHLEPDYPFCFMQTKCSSGHVW